MNAKECKELLDELEGLEKLRAALSAVNDKTNNAVLEAAVRLRYDKHSTFTKVVYLERGWLQQYIINQIRDAEHAIRSYGVEPS